MFKSLKDYPTEEIAEMVLAGCKEYADEGYSISMSTRIGNEQCITLYFSDGSKKFDSSEFYSCVFSAIQEKIGYKLSPEQKMLMAFNFNVSGFGIFQTVGKIVQQILDATMTYDEFFGARAYLDTMKTRSNVKC